MWNKIKAWWEWAKPKSRKYIAAVATNGVILVAGFLATHGQPELGTYLVGVAAVVGGAVAGWVIKELP